MDTHYKITAEPHPSDRSVTLLLNGKLTENVLTELEESISAARNARQRVYIDLGEVTLVDRRTVEYFLQCASEDIRLVNCPVYLRHWLRQASDEAEF